MTASESLHPDQFIYRSHVETDDMGDAKYSVGVFHPATGEGVGQITAKREDTQGDPSIRPEVGTAYVRPEFRGIGVADKMYHALGHAAGGTSLPTSSRSLSPAGLKYAQRMTGGNADVDRPTTGPWTETPELHENVAGVKNGNGERIFGSPTMQKVLGPEGRQMDVSALEPRQREPNPTTKQSSLFRKHKGDWVPIKKVAG